MVAYQFECAVFVREDAFSAGIVAGCEQSVAISRSHRGIEMRVGIEFAGDRRIGCGCLEERRQEPSDGEYYVQ